MFDSNKKEQNILFRDEFDGWANNNRDLKIIYSITEEHNRQSSFTSPSDSWTGERGRINKDMISKHRNENEMNNSIFYVCGPPAMLNTVKSVLENDLKVAQDRIKAEEFTGY